MTRPAVWAPFPQQLELELHDGRRPLESRDGGWRQATTYLPEASDYAFRLDGTEPPLPDPRSPWQPGGVHGWSRTVDHSAFGWTDHGWRGFDLRSAVIYELHVGTFAPEGTFAGVAARLDHLLDLGANVIELMPVAEFAGARGWGYDGVDLYAPHHAYGGPEALKRLVDACHHRGLGVVLDVVYNHLGPEGNYLERYGPYFTDRYTTPWGKAVNFDGPGSDEVRRFFFDNALMWLRDYHFDGLRLDAVHAIVDTSAVHFLEELELKVEALAADVGRPLHLIAESAANDPRLVWDRAHGGYGLAATWSDDLHHALHSVLTGERTGYYCDYGSLQDVAMALRHAYVYAGRFSKFRRKTYGRPADGLSGARFLTYVQNHDQVGNRARGDRISHLVGRGRLKIAAALVLTSPFVPLIFMGEEWASSTPFPFFVSHTDRAVAQGATKGRRREFEAFGWKAEDVPDPMDPATFESAKLRWDELAQDEHRDIYEFYRALLRLRRDEGLCAGDMASVRVDADDATGRLVVRRGRVAIACNLGAATLEPGIEGEVLLASEPEATSRSLPTDAVVVVRA